MWGNWCSAAALQYKRVRAGFTLAALGGNAQFELDVVKTHARARSTGDAVLTASTADANDHGEHSNQRGRVSA